MPPAGFEEAGLKEIEAYKAYLKAVKRSKRGGKYKTRAPKLSKKAGTKFKLNAAKKFKFEVYRLAKDDLETCFHFKCAYCESSYGHVSNIHIDHYRPKGRVDREGRKPIGGYYWLAAAWQNLLPVCGRCNSPTKEFVPALSKKVIVGKCNWFPLWDETKRARGPGREKKEYPLLINPCEEDPQEYLVFHENGIVEARKTLPKKKKLKAEKSIAIYGLWRMKLIKAREEHAKRIRGTIVHVQESYGDWTASRGKMKERMRLRLLREWTELQQYLKPSVPYLSMARTLINDKLSGSIQKEIRQLQMRAKKDI
jgi:uncharacterized protein (TIGR02646 family)